MHVEFYRLRAAARDGRVWACAIACTLLVLPIVVAHHLNVIDGPGHEARLAVLHDALIGGHPSPYYRITSFFLPNVAYDVIGLGLASFGGPEVAARIFLGLTLILTLTGTMVLSRAAIGRWSVVPLVAALVAHNLFVVEGFLNYVFGLALVPWVLALRLKLGGWKGFAAGVCGAILLLFCHLFDFALFAVMASGFAFNAWREKKITVTGFLLRLLECAPAVLLALLMPHDPSRSLHFDFAGKLPGVLKSFSSGSIAGDVAFLAGAALFAASLFFARVRLARPLVPGLIMLALLYAVMPYELGHGAYVDKRLPIAAALFFAAALDVRCRRPALARGFAALIALAFVVKQGALTTLWSRMDERIAAAAATLNALPAGSEIFRAECRPANSPMVIYHAHQPALTHVAALATFEQTRFYGGIWAIPGQQPIAVRPAYEAAHNVQNWISWSVCGEKPLRSVASRIRALADGRPHYLFVIRPEKPHSVHATLVAVGGGFEVYRIDAR